jgi:hypothetical protein
MYQTYNRWITRFIIPFIALLFITVGRPVPLWRDLANRDIYFDFLFSLLIALVTWHLVVFSQENLDKRHNWYSHFYRRLIYQGLFGVAAPALLMMGLYYGYMKLYYHKYFDIERSVFFGVDLPVGILIILLMNLGLVLIFLVNHTRASKETVAPPVIQPEVSKVEDAPSGLKARKHLLTVKGSKNVLLDVEDIAYILLENEVSKAYTFGESCTMIGDPLDTLMSQLPSSFYRANRQTIINVRAIKAFKAERSGKLILDVHPAPSTPITVSQKQSVAFKQWLMSDYSA